MLYLILFFIFLLFIIFFTATEIALISASPIKIRHRAKSGDRRAKQIIGFFSQPEGYFATILVGTNFFVVAITVIATRAFSHYWGFTGKVLTTFIVSFFILFLGEIIPKSLSRIYANSVALINFPLLKGFHILFFPFSWLVRAISHLILFRIEGNKNRMFKEDINRETLQWALQRTVMGDKIRKIDKEIFSKIFQFSEKPVSDVMIPRVGMKMIKYPFKIKEVLRMAEMTGLSRFPVYRQDTDRIMGILTIKDVFIKEHDRISEMIRPVKFVPPNKRCDALLSELKDETTHMAVVVNEYGETEGLVTLEDLVEELFGEIVDEFDTKDKEGMIKKIDSKKYLVRGLSRVNEINEELNLNIPTGDYDTISGFIMDYLQKLPTEDTKIEMEKCRLIVKEMDGQKIKRVIVEIKEI
ncbi:MAG: HlyC/CorC family transporter [Candidatus Cloacimonadota bacterium]|nr:MAG: HlyC/CorC family transporter [Candidatus Cloacimonadota bacterium]